MKDKDKAVKAVKAVKAKDNNPTIKELVALIDAAAAEAANYQERFAAEDTEARKIVSVMENFLRITARVVYGGAAINAHLSEKNKFYDPTLYLPDYDFMTPDPLQDCADLIHAFQSEGFTEVEAKFGIHEGTYKIFVNFRAAADITYMPPDIYGRIIMDSAMIDGIHYASVNYLRMNMYLELSRPWGMVTRWKKVYERLLLLNEEHPLKPGRCSAEPLSFAEDKDKDKDTDKSIHDRIVAAGMDSNVIFLTGLNYLTGASTSTELPVMMMSEHADKVATGLTVKRFEAMGELLPARTEIRTKKRKLVAVIFDAVACHSYRTLAEPKGYRLGSVDLLIQMYYALYFAQLKNYVPGNILCIIHALIEIETTQRLAALKDKSVPAIHYDCIGHQPTLPELKKAHRDRVRDKRKELEGILRVTRKRKHK